MNPDQLKALRDLWSKATQGVWRVSSDRRFWVDMEGDRPGAGWKDNRDNDAAYVAAIHEATAALLDTADRVAELEAEVERHKHIWKAAQRGADRFAHEADKAEALLAERDAEVASLRASLGEPSGAEPVGCPCPGACSAINLQTELVRLRDALNAHAPELGRLMAFDKMLTFLRSEEGDSVELLADNPDFNGQPNNAIECCGSWTDWEALRFVGETLNAAVSAAYDARAALSPPASAGGE